MSAEEGQPGSAPDASAPDADRFLDLLRNRRLTPAQRRIARYLLEHRGEAAMLTSGDLSARTGVSQPSVSRFAQALGFSGYPELRRYLHLTLAQRHAAGSSSTDSSTRFRQAIDLEVANLRSLADDEQEAAMTKAGALLAGSPTIVVVGLRASEPLAHYLAFFARKIHPDVRLVTVGNSRAKDELAQAQAAGAHAMVCLALPRCPRETMSLFEFALDLGFQTVLVSDDHLSHMARRATVTLRAKVATELVFDSQAAPMLIVAGLIDAMADVDATRTQQRLDDFESRAAAEAYFDSP